MVIAGVLQTVAEVAVRMDIPWAWVTTAEDLDIEMIVGRRRDGGELLIGESHSATTRKSEKKLSANCAPGLCRQRI